MRAAGGGIFLNRSCTDLEWEGRGGGGAGWVPLCMLRWPWGNARGVLRSIQSTSKCSGAATQRGGCVRREERDFKSRGQQFQVGEFEFGDADDNLPTPIDAKKRRANRVGLARNAGGTGTTNLSFFLTHIFGVPVKL
jgi:hypothetical protein